MPAITLEVDAVDKKDALEAFYAALEFGKPLNDEPIVEEIKD